MAEVEFDDDPAARLQRARDECDACHQALDASRQREILLTRELHHRVRNLLAVVRSLFSRTIETAETLDQVADHFPGRLNTLARYQAQLTLMPGSGVDLEMMISDELVTVAAANDPRVVIGGPEVRIGYDQASALALAIHELVINSVKYGVLAASDDRGMLRVGWTLRDRHLLLDWSETGVAVVARAPIPEGFGREYIEQALPYQLGADTSFEIRPGGVRCTIGLTVNSHSSPAATDASPAEGR